MLCLKALVKDGALTRKLRCVLQDAFAIRSQPSDAKTRRNICLIVKTIRVGAHEAALRSAVLFVGVSRAELAISIALVFEAALRFGLTLLILLAIAAEARERHRAQTLFGNFEPARLAHPVGSIRDALEGIVDLLELNALAIGENEVDLSIALLGRKVVGVHALVLVAFTLGLQFRIDLVQQLGLRVQQRLAHTGQEFLAVRGCWFLCHLTITPIQAIKPARSPRW